MSASCHSRHFVTQRKASLFDHRVGALLEEHVPTADVGLFDHFVGEGK